MPGVKVRAIDSLADVPRRQVSGHRIAMQLLALYLAVAHGEISPQALIQRQSCTL